MLRNPQLHAAVVASPDDDEPRLVYADWLIERGDPRGDFIALQIARAKLQRGEPREVELAARERLLKKAHGQPWYRPYEPLAVTYRRGFIEHVTGRPHEVAAGNFEETCVLGLGLWSPDYELPIGESLRAIAELPLPLRHLECHGLHIGLGVFEHLVDRPAFAELEALFLDRTAIGEEDVFALAACEMPLVKLDLSNNILGDAAAE